MAIFTEEKVKKLSPTKMTANDWINLSVDWYINAKPNNTSRKDFAIMNNVSLSAFERALTKFRPQIKAKVELSKKVPSKKRVDIINQFRQGLRARAADSNVANNNKSVKWFNNKIASSVKGKQVSKPTPGSIFTYVYDAKGKDTLAYWDRFPLMIYLGPTKAKNGNTLMIGLNLHYIPPKARQDFLEELLVYISTKNFKSDTRLNINWSQVKSVRYAPYMIKAYLPNHIQSALTQIEPEEWINIIYMPTQQFISKGKRFSSNKVWSNSIS